MDSFTVFEEQNDEINGGCSEFACQTEEIAFSEADAQTIEGAVLNNENSKCEEDSEIGYWKTVVANRKIQIERIKRLNEKMEEEKTAKAVELEEKQTEYTQLFNLGNEKLKSKEEENSEDEEDEEEEDEEEEEGKCE